MLGLPGHDPEMHQELEVAPHGVDMQADTFGHLGHSEGGVGLADRLQDGLTPLSAVDLVCHRDSSDLVSMNDWILVERPLAVMGLWSRIRLANHHVKADVI
jgi:hypothetical protein